MLNGKFYTGLPEKMMGHSKGPDRQKTNFFWPDESDMEQAVDTRTKLRQQSRKEMTPERSDFKDISPNALHKNQLSSKISFYDTVDRKPKSPILPATKSVIKPEKNVNIKRRDTFTSKIQFYDFEGDSKPQMVNRNKNSNIEVENNAKNSTKNCDKRISFTENELRDNSPGRRSILKNNETIAANSTRVTKVQPTSRTSSSISKSRKITSTTNEMNPMKNSFLQDDRNESHYEELDQLFDDLDL